MRGCAQAVAAAVAAADSDGEMLRLRSACAEAQAAAKAAVAQLCNATAPLAQAEATARTAEHLSTVRAQVHTFHFLWDSAFNQMVRIRWWINRVSISWRGMRRGVTWHSWRRALSRCGSGGSGPRSTPAPASNTAWCAPSSETDSSRSAAEYRTDDEQTLMGACVVAGQVVARVARDHTR